MIYYFSNLKMSFQPNNAFTAHKDILILKIAIIALKGIAYYSSFGKSGLYSVSFLVNNE